MLRLPTEFLEMRQVGETLSRVHDAANAREAVSGKTAVADGVMLILCVAML
jgi:ABC-type bacteriocin/lantibiotic exporter with double-glycine peptidase domain